MGRATRNRSDTRWNWRDLLWFFFFLIEFTWAFLPSLVCMFFFFFFAMIDMHIYTFWVYSIPPLMAAVWGHSGRSSLYCFICRFRNEIGYTWVHMFNPFQVLPFSTEIGQNKCEFFNSADFPELTHDFHHRGTRLGEYWNYGGGYYIW